ncbi:MAG: hypothetical protein ABL921_19900 [Pirellula sp.]
MAGEIRMLEDRVYEYDAAYQDLEAEVDELSRKNDQLERKYRDLKASNSLNQGAGRRPSNSPPAIVVEPEPYELSPQNTPTRDAFEIPSVLMPDSNLPSTSSEKPPSVLRSPAAPPPIRENVVPAKPHDALPPASELLPSGTGSDKQPTSPNEPRAQFKNQIKRDGSGSKAAETLVEQVVMPETMIRSAQQPKGLAAPPTPMRPTPSHGIQFEPSPSNAPSLLPRALKNFPTGNPQGALKRNQILMPEGSKVQFASATEPIDEKKENQRATEITDKRVIEIGFHPTLCRGHNFDETPGDDGLYLVVTPLNSAGQVINQSGTLTVVIEDEAIAENNGRIEAREYSPKELEEMLSPIGADQGYHVSVPWSHSKPVSPSVVVYLRYKLEDGRSLVNKRIVHLRKPMQGQSAWTPRP